MRDYSDEIEQPDPDYGPFADDDYTNKITIERLKKAYDRIDVNKDKLDGYVAADYYDGKRVYFYKKPGYQFNRYMIDVFNERSRK